MFQTCERSIQEYVENQVFTTKTLKFLLVENKKNPLKKYR